MIQTHQVINFCLNCLNNFLKYNIKNDFFYIAGIPIFNIMLQKILSLVNLFKFEH